MQAEIAVLRFGLGARPGEILDAKSDPRDWLRAQIKGAAPSSGKQVLAPSQQIFTDFLAAREQRRQLRDGDPAKDPVNFVREAYLPHYRQQVLSRAQSAALTRRPFAERLVHFWANHFAVSADKGVVLGLAGTVENEAIRPNVNGNFGDLLLAVEQHPAMIAFLDNQASVGPNSKAARNLQRFDSSRRLGINENLAREILELHTLSVNGGYTQADVTAFAKVITGWSIGGVGRQGGGESGRFFFRDNVHEPGPQRVLGKTYNQSGRAQGEALLRDLAHHPSTAAFIATKMARHFVADEPPAALVTRLAKAFTQSGGHLPTVYATLIDSADAWQPAQPKFKTPEDLVFSTLRAFEIEAEEPQEIMRSFEFLGQRQYTPGSPAGWPDTAKSWDGSDALMHRVQWANKIGEKFERGANPVELAHAVLGDYAAPLTLSALGRATSANQALALLVMSPEFQRR